MERKQSAAEKKRSLGVALIQLRPGTEDVAQNCDHMASKVKQAIAEAEQPVHVVVLPEMWSCLVTPEGTRQAAEPVPVQGSPRSSWSDMSYVIFRLSDVAAGAGVWLVGGSIPEIKDGKRYNTSLVFDPHGELVKVYRKLHLFDLCLPKMTYKESDQFSPGNELGLFDTPFGKMAVAICYDIRFPELAMHASRSGCVAMFYPAAFNTVTGPLHWELLQRSRALDNQMFVATCSPARDTGASYVAYGHSMAVSPMGQVLATAGEGEEIVYATFDLRAIQDSRQGIPISTQRRFDMYSDLMSYMP